MRKIKYGEEKDKYTGNSETHIATDVHMDEGSYDSLRLEEGFAASDGVRAGTAESGGRQRVPESSDKSYPDRTPATIRRQNPGLADN